MSDLDETIFPRAEFRGQWNHSDPPLWENFSICLFGNEAGDLITDPPDIHEALESSGYRLVLEKIEPQALERRTKNLRLRVEQNENGTNRET